MNEECTARTDLMGDGKGFKGVHHVKIRRLAYETRCLSRNHVSTGRYWVGTKDHVNKMIETYLAKIWEEAEVRSG